MFTLRERQTLAIRHDVILRALADELKATNCVVEYDAGAKQVVGTDRCGRRTRFQLGASGTVLTTTTGCGRILRDVIDEEGRVAERVAASGFRTQFTYDQQGLPGSFAQNGTKLAEFAWNAEYTVQVARFWDGTTSRSEYDAQHRPVSLTNRSGGIDRFQWTEAGQLANVVDALGQATRFDYDGAELPTRTTYSDGRVETFGRDAAGHCVELFAGESPIYQAERGPAGRPLRIQYADDREYTFAYDDAGRPISATGPDGASSYAYDEEGKVVSETNDGQTFAFEYDATNLLVAIQYPDGSKVRFAYDADSRLSHVADWSGAVSSFQYAGDESRSYISTPNGLDTSLELAGHGRPSRCATFVRASGQVISDVRCEYDVQKRLVARSDLKFGERRFHYDADSRLLGVTDPTNWVEWFSYDAAGNRQNSSAAGAAHAPGNLLTQLGNLSCEYDARGNVCQMREGEQRWTLTYDLRNQLTRVDGPGGRVSYKYDAFGRRIEKLTDASSTRYVWCGEQLAREVITTARGESTRDYLYLPGTYTPFALRVDTSLYYFHTDHRGTPQRLSDASGKVVWEAEYDAFGRARVHVSDVDNPLRFAGQYEDRETGLHYNRFRYYHPTLGRYVSVDPLGLGTGHHLYAYCGNDPINRSDPLGLFWKEVGIVVAGTLAGAAVIALAPVAIPYIAAAALLTVAAVLVDKVVTVAHNGFCWECFKKGFGPGFVEGALFTAGSLVACAAFPPLAFGLMALGTYSLLDEHFGWTTGVPFSKMTPAQQSKSLGGLVGSLVGAGVVLGLEGLAGKPLTRLGRALRPTPKGPAALPPPQASGGDPAAPARAPGEPVGSDGLTSRQRAYFDDQIDNAPNDQAKQQAKYDRNVANRANRGDQPMSPDDWKASSDNVQQNQRTGKARERVAQDDLGIDDNNTSPDRQTVPKANGKNAVPDSVTDEAIVDVKSMPDDMPADGKPRTLNQSDQLRAEQSAARASGKEPVTVISNKNPNAVRPSGPLADNSTVLHHDPATGDFSRWDPNANRGSGGWDPISQSEARSLVGGDPGAPRAVPAPVPDQHDEDGATP